MGSSRPHAQRDRRAAGGSTSALRSRRRCGRSIRFPPRRRHADEARGARDHPVRRRRRAMLAALVRRHAAEGGGDRAAGGGRRRRDASLSQAATAASTGSLSAARGSMLDRSGEVKGAAVPAFFFFHIANAFDVAGGGVASCLYFSDPQILTGLRLDSLTSDAKARDLPRSRLRASRSPPTAARRRWPRSTTRTTGEFTDPASIAPAAVGRSATASSTPSARRGPCVSNRLHKTDVAGAGGDRTFEVEGTLPASRYSCRGRVAATRTTVQCCRWPPTPTAALASTSSTRRT